MSGPQQIEGHLMSHSPDTNDTDSHGNNLSRENSVVLKTE
jgi:hypothetical protein